LREVGAFIDGAEDVLDTDLRTIPDTYDNAGGAFIIADVEGDIVGMGGVCRVDASTAEIRRMRVSSNHQGKGLGSQLLRTLETKAKDLGYKRLILDTAIQQEAAVHLYTKFGYTVYKRGMFYNLDTVWMEKDI
jgi:GNAT superfamily N-acetyltransferase